MVDEGPYWIQEVGSQAIASCVVFSEDGVLCLSGHVIYCVTTMAGVVALRTRKY